MVSKLLVIKLLSRGTGSGFYLCPCFDLGNLPQLKHLKIDLTEFTIWSFHGAYDALVDAISSTVGLQTLDVRVPGPDSVGNRSLPYTLDNLDDLISEAAEDHPLPVFDVIVRGVPPDLKLEAHPIARTRERGHAMTTTDQ